MPSSILSLENSMAARSSCWPRSVSGMRSPGATGVPSGLKLTASAVLTPGPLMSAGIQASRSARRASGRLSMAARRPRRASRGSGACAACACWTSWTLLPSVIVKLTEASCTPLTMKRSSAIVNGEPRSQVTKAVMCSIWSRVVSACSAGSNSSCSTRLKSPTGSFNAAASRACRYSSDSRCRSIVQFPVASKASSAASRFSSTSRSVSLMPSAASSSGVLGSVLVSVGSAVLNA